MRRLEGVNQWGSAYLDALQGQQRPPSSQIQRVAPGILDMIPFVARWLKHGVKARVSRKFYKEQWFIAYRNRPTNEATADMNGFTIIRPPRDRYYADPFVIARGGLNYVFFEDYRYATGKGLISFVSIGRDGKLSEPEVVLERDYHLSYPFLFEWNGEVFMIPETRHAGVIEIYRAVSFPRGWVREAVLMEDVEAVDSTLLHYGGKFWLFAGGVTKGGSINGELHIFHAASPFGEWRPHRLNPVVCDVCTARPAGQLFFENGQLIRPSQDCCRRYGYAVSFNRIDVLSETCYRETKIRTIQPNWIKGNKGTHTFNQNEYLQVTDGKVLIRN